MALRTILSDKESALHKTCKPVTNFDSRLFTLLDDVFTPLIFAFHPNAALVYFLGSLYAVIPQSICTAVTVSVCFRPLTKAIQKINF